MLNVKNGANLLALCCCVISEQPPYTGLDLGTC